MWHVSLNSIIRIMSFTVLSYISCFNPFLFIENKCLFISLEGFSTLEKNALICDQRARQGLNSKFLNRVWQPSADNNGAQEGHYYLQRAVTPDQITQQNTVVCRGQERLKGRKDTLRPDFQANTRPRIILKSQITTRYKKIFVRKSRYS